MAVTTDFLKGLDVEEKIFLPNGKVKKCSLILTELASNLGLPINFTTPEDHKDDLTTLANTLSTRYSPEECASLIGSMFGQSDIEDAINSKPECKLAVLQAKYSEAQAEAEKAKAELATTKDELVKIQTDLAETQAMAKQAIAELATTKDELVKTQAELQAKSAEVNDTKAMVTNAARKLSELQARLEAQEQRINDNTIAIFALPMAKSASAQQEAEQLRSEIQPIASSTTVASAPSLEEQNSGHGANQPNDTTHDEELARFLNDEELARSLAAEEEQWAKKVHRVLL